MRWRWTSSRPACWTARRKRCASWKARAYESQALLALLAIYERSRDWAQASEIAQKLDESGHGNFSGRLAHYLCEQAAAAPPDASGAVAARGDARSRRRPPAPASNWRRCSGAPATRPARSSTLSQLAHSAPAAIPLVAKSLTEAALASSQQAQAIEVLLASYELSPSLDVLEGIVALEPDATVAREWYVKHLEREPSLVAATKWLAGEKLEHEQFHPHVQSALDHAVKPLTRYRCAACGFEAKQHFWQCPGCQAWDSYPARRVEEL